MHLRLQTMAQAAKIADDLKDREKFEILLELNPKTEHVFRILIDLIRRDKEIMISSGHIRTPAHDALAALGKEANYTQQVVMLIMDDLYRFDGGGWNHLMLLYDILGDQNIIPFEDRGKFNRIKAHWLHWGEENGYFVPIESVSETKIKVAELFGPEWDNSQEYGSA